MPAAVEDAVVGAIDLGVLVGPQAPLGARIQPRVHGAGHEPAAEGSKETVEIRNRRLEGSRQRFEVGIRTQILEFDKMQHELVGPGEPPRDFACAASVRIAQQLIGDRQQRQAVAVDDHVFQFYSIRSEGVERGTTTHRGTPRLRSSMLIQ